MILKSTHREAKTWTALAFIVIIALLLMARVAAAQTQTIQQNTPATQNRSSCIEFACNSPALDCSFDSDLNSALAACVDVDTSCAKAACARGKECSFESDLFDALNRCKHNPPRYY